jgi:hypothetical protein
VIVPLTTITEVEISLGTVDLYIIPCEGINFNFFARIEVDVSDVALGILHAGNRWTLARRSRTEFSGETLSHIYWRTRTRIDVHPRNSGLAIEACFDVDTIIIV